MRSRRTAATALLLTGLALGGLTACGDDSTDAGDSRDSGTPAAVGDATSADTDLDGEADPGAEITADEMCAFLTEEAPQVVDLQPAEYAASQFGLALFDFYTEKGLLTDIDGAEVDTLSAQGCPDVAAELLPALGASSFAELLSS